MKFVAQFNQAGREFSKTIELSTEPSVGETVIVDNHRLVVQERIHIAGQDIHLVSAMHSNMTPELLKAGQWDDTTDVPFILSEKKHVSNVPQLKVPPHGAFHPEVKTKNK